MHGRCGAVEEHATVAERDDPVEVVQGEGHGMKAGNKCATALRGDADQQPDQRLGARGINRGHRLVGEDRLRVLDEQAGEGNPLLLTTGEPGCALIELLADADPLQREGGALALTRRHERDE